MEKIKLILVDDELTSRNTIKKYLEEDATYEIVADFQNGKTALEWMRKNTVDILLCDMQMPEMNGVELMRNVHIIDEYLPIIAISGFDDFNFVRGSLVNGAANYLLKHELSREYLIRTLDQVREQYRIVPKGSKIYRKRGFCFREREHFQTENIRRMIQKDEIDFECTNICPVLISPDYKSREELNWLEYRQDISKAVMDIVSQVLGDNHPYITYVSPECRLVVMISFAKEKSLLFMMNTISNFAGRLQRSAIRMLDTTLSIVCGDVHTTIEEAMDEVPLMCQLADDKFYLGENRIVYETVTKKINYSDNDLPEKYWEQLEFELSNQMSGCIDTISEMLEYMEKYQLEKKRVILNSQRILEMMISCGYVEEEVLLKGIEQIRETEVYGQIKTVIMDLLHRGTQAQKREEKKQYSDTITRAVEYVKKNYMSDISLEKCADVVGCSYTSLSKEFKKETGMRFVEFLNHQRVNKAKSLLIRNDIAMKEIVEMAGFRNYNYFFKVFKEMVGVTPNEFATKK